MATNIIYVDTNNNGDFICDGVDDHIEINQALDKVANDNTLTTVHLNGPNTYWINNTLLMGNNTTLTGDSTATIKLIDNASLGYLIPFISNIPGNNHDFIIQGFKINGNNENQSVLQGRGYHNMMSFNNCSNIKVTNMRLEHGQGDGLKVEHTYPYIGTPANIIFSNNSIYKLGHDALYTMRLNHIIAANNDVFTRTNSAFRLSASGNAKIYNNTIHSELAGWSTGPGIQLDKRSGYISDNVEIYNNTLHTLNGAGIWITGGDADHVIRAQHVHIHHNILYNIGQYWTDTGYSNAAITIGQFNNTIIENNVINDGGHAGIKRYIYNTYHMNSQFTTIVRNNIIINCKKNVAAGIWNYDDTNHKFISKYNCIYNNTGGNYNGQNIISTNDIHVNPLFVNQSNNDYHLQSLSPCIDIGDPSSNYSNEPQPNGNRINIGRYGNTSEATKSLSTTPTPTTTPTSSPTPGKVYITTLSRGYLIKTLPFLLQRDNGEDDYYLYAPTGSDFGSGAYADYSIIIPKSDTYKIVARVIAQDDASNSFFIQIDNKPQKTWDLKLSENCMWRDVSARGTGTDEDQEYPIYTEYLTQGTHKIKILHRENNTRLYRFIVTNDMSYLTGSSTPSPTPIKQYYISIYSNPPNAIITKI